MKSIVLALSVAFLGGCVSVSAIRTGNEVYPPLASGEPIAVFDSEASVPAPFSVVGMLRYVNPGKYQILNTDSALPDLMSQARAMGANAIIIDSSEPIRSGIISTGVAVTGRAIRLLPLVPPPTPTPAQIPGR